MRTDAIKYMCFSGGGIRGISYAHALDELQRLLRFDFGRIEGVVGTSAGALYAAALASEMTTQQMLEIANSTSIQDLCTINYVVNAHLLLTKWGLATQDQLIAYIDSFLGASMVTLADLYQRTGKLLVVCVTNLNTNCAEYWSHETHPQMPVAKAVATSMALPPVFTPTLIDGCTFVDGGLVDNFPCHVFPQQQTLCFRVKWGSLAQHQIDGVQKYFSRITYAMLTGLERTKFERMNAACHTITIDCGDTATFTWQVEAETRTLLQSCGRTAVRRFVLKNNLRALRLSPEENATETYKATDYDGPDATRGDEATSTVAVTATTTAHSSGECEH